ncbi:hypothetical protein AB0C34_23030 [Nocardia sp. NPDC049220]
MTFGVYVVALGMGWLSAAVGTVLSFLLVISDRGAVTTTPALPATVP